MSGEKAKRRKPPARATAPSPAVATMPNVGGEDAEFRMLVHLFDQADSKAALYRGLMVANDQSEDDPVSGEEPLRSDGTVNSYRLRLQELDAQKRRLAEAYPHLLPRLRQLVEDRDRKAERSGT